MFELNKYEKQVETNISICFILMLMSDLGTAVAWIGLAACAILFGQLVYYPFWCKKKRRIFICAVVDSLSALLVYIYLLDCS